MCHCIQRYQQKISRRLSRFIFLLQWFMRHFERKDIKIFLSKTNITLSHIQGNSYYLTPRPHVKMDSNLTIVQESYEENYFFNVLSDIIEISKIWDFSSFDKKTWWKSCVCVFQSQFLCFYMRFIIYIFWGRKLWSFTANEK